MVFKVNLEEFSDSIEKYYETKKPRQEIMDRKKVLQELRDEIEAKRCKIEDINTYIIEAEENLNTYNHLKEKFQHEIEQIEDTLELMEI